MVFTEGIQCPTGAECIRVASYDMALFHGSFTWYEAWNTCKRLGTHLFVFNESETSQMLKRINKTVVTHGHMWVGLSRKQFVGESLNI